MPKCKPCHKKFTFAPGCNSNNVNCDSCSYCDHLDWKCKPKQCPASLPNGRLISDTFDLSVNSTAQLMCDHHNFISPPPASTPVSTEFLSCKCDPEDGNPFWVLLGKQNNGSVPQPIERCQQGQCITNTDCL